ncbi:membrane protein YqaA, SNARE-associated domain [Methanococcoides vulcani]|uniref:Membrane protein YqaA, SNARE-associated domain n=1 Tax=Methanococcoides vulcani TaxID=1353158 RepID=A0A1I0B4R1_9EURY|nr:VTT domain-containing protein [Methanococcoides vulcani]SET01090.1 membrane protein YqaA, SNARE-associated domain [Methanococcoides vulcani]
MKIKNEKLIPSKTDNNEMEICPHYDGKRNIQILGLIVLFIASWSILLFYHPPGEIVERLGVRNIYIFVFLLAMIGGVSTFTSTTFYTALITISLGGVNPIWIALLASIGLTFGDLAFYYLGTKGRQCIKGKYAGNVFRLTKWMEKIDDRITMLMIFFYSLTPLPSDIIAISLAIVGFPFRKMIIPLFVGNFTLIFMLVELSKLGYSLI